MNVVAPFFSIIIPTCNRGAFLVETVKSVLNQSYSNFEVIVIDDGSTDNTAQLIDREFGTENRVKYFWQNNAERGAARNHGINKAKGEYIIFLDSDDLFEPEHLSVLEKAINQNKFIKMITTHFRFLANDAANPANKLIIKPGWYSKDLFLKGNHFACNFCIKRETIGDKRFEEDLKYTTMEDWMFILSVIEQHEILVLSEETVIMQDHPDRSMKQDNEKIINSKLNATKWIEDNVDLSSRQRELLLGNSYYFIAIHKYLDTKRAQALKYLFLSIAKSRINWKTIVLIIKVIIGRKSIQHIRGGK